MKKFKEGDLVFFIYENTAGRWSEGISTKKIYKITKSTRSQRGMLINDGIGFLHDKDWLMHVDNLTRLEKLIYGVE